MSRLEDLEAFIHIAETGSLTKAARLLNRSLQAVSRSLAALEQDVGVQLVHRSTRHCALSEAGETFFLRVKPAVAEIGEARLEVADRRTAPSGLLRVGAPILFGPDFLVPVIAQYMQAYPQVEVDLQLTDSFTDLSSAGLDLVVRIADLPDSGLQGRRLGTLRRVVFGARSYFEQHGRPSHPSELRQHACIVRTVDQHPGQWVFQIDGKRRAVGVRGPFRTNTMAAIYRAVSAGLGIGYSPLWQIKHLLDAGQVETILEDFEPKPVPIHALWQENRLPPAKVRAFVDHLVERLRLDQL
ncbi:LysR family transcriptional regulator [Achromobacter insolitus]|uniref:HTH-type transcriptional regulator DmlR n=1 Tax=Achromobacter insolitus TaxID=217204 RepID=A0A6S7F578_9BURK|nr:MULTISPECIES: LysR family transcriptional regulator [Achromobacter]AVG41170.1 LysR family transcriptional regulator [Achromobacter insolitus]MEB3097801.1 LysR family transcriptional regulator [Achromobacter sp. D10]QEK91274.1 LysR family transcriptional regulator [Achromobacter insolitus]CAB3930316.1 HTH-type transcriptional regulator DmlR [Achromobacter insolitus]CAB3933364.1 HTH-type transcriptional regulator DmlR [Achromobacter insolitus]